MTTALLEARKHLAAGRRVVPLAGKRPVGRDWANAWRDPDTVERYLAANAGANLGLILGDVLDIEWDSAAEEQAFRELFSGIEIPRTPCFTSPRGTHTFFKAHPRLFATGRGVLSYKKLGIRIGAGKAAQTAIPPSRNDDGTIRRWAVSFEDCEPAELPEVVVDRILEQYKAVAPASGQPAGSAAEAAMLRYSSKDGNDGSKRLHYCACRAVEHDLNDADAIAAIRRVALSRPFPREWTDEEILARVRDAEKVEDRGSADTSLWTQEGRTDTANARRFAARFGHMVRWCEPWRKWLVWDGRRWAVDDHCAIEALGKTVAKELWQQAYGDTENKDAIRHARYTNSAQGIANMLRLARSEPGISITPDVLDQDRLCLNVLNGTVDLRTGLLRAHVKDDYLTKLAPVEFIPQAECPVWLAFLDRIFASDTELIRFVQRLGGYSLTGDVREQILAIFHGGGSNGKSTWLNTLLAIFGDYGLKAPASLLLDRGGDNHPTVSATLAGKRLAVVSETGDGRQLAEARIKELTGGEPVSARRMREDYWSFDPTHKIVLATNHKPQISGTDHAIWRRIRLVPFAVTIADCEQDKLLPEKLRAEYPGILRWMVEGCLAWQQQGLGIATEVASATAAYKAAEDGLGEFLATCCELSPNAQASATALLGAYVDYSGDRAMSTRRFASLLRDRGFINRQATGGANRGRMVWHGLGLSSDVAGVESISA